ncbi:hypothetical protein [Acidovorax sp. FJL06]|uniref:hypothetical protein n=1 Tax=Acidovorax sp. FJL06 TaxID=2153365 RepID=UPI000F5755B4|nr:hypothetical protein [Acidovorax sp. FJL06]
MINIERYRHFYRKKRASFAGAGDGAIRQGATFSTSSSISYSIPKNAPHPKIRRDPVILVVVDPEGLAQLRENGCTAAIFSEYVQNVFFLLLSLVPMHQAVNNAMSPPASS